MTLLEFELAAAAGKKGVQDQVCRFPFLVQRMPCLTPLGVRALIRAAHHSYAFASLPVRP